MFWIKSSPDHQASAILQPDFDPRVARYVGLGLHHSHFHKSRRRVFPQPLLPPVEMRPAQLPLAAERRHTLPTPHLFGSQPAPLRPSSSISFSLRHRATLLCHDHLLQDAVHVALTKSLREVSMLVALKTRPWEQLIVWRLTRSCNTKNICLLTI